MNAENPTIRELLDIRLSELSKAVEALKEDSTIAVHNRADAFLRIYGVAKSLFGDEVKIYKERYFALVKKASEVRRSLEG